VASGEARSGTVTTAGGDLGPAANARHAGTIAPGSVHGAPDEPEVEGSADIDASAVVDRSAVVTTRTPGPFSPRQLSRIDEALTLSSRETGLEFSVWVGALDEPTREHADRLHAGLPHPARGVLVAVSPGQRVLHIVTGEDSSRRLPDRSCALAALSMRASLTVGDLTGALVNGLRMLSDQAGRPNERPGGSH
jgi:hypothetical protein